MYYAPVDLTSEFMVTRPAKSLIALELGHTRVPRTFSLRLCIGYGQKRSPEVHRSDVFSFSELASVAVTLISRKRSF